MRGLMCLGTATAGATLALLAALPAHAQDRNYYCGDGAGAINVRIVSQTRISTFIEMYGSADGAFSMNMTGGAGPSGFYFSNGEYSIEITGAEQDILIYTAPDFGEIYCTWGDDRSGAPPILPDPTLDQNDDADDDEDDEDDDDDFDRNDDDDQGVDETAGLPAAGFSCGGKVRSAPNLNSRQIGSLQNGDPITILEYAGDMDGYSWFKIRYNGNTGYQWGGILSVADGHLPGAFVGC